MNNDIAIIALRYLEPEYQATIDCLEACGLPYYFAERDGVGNMSRAFNDAFEKHVRCRYKAVWFITNIEFEPALPLQLFNALNYTVHSAVHPAMTNSDHLHLRPDVSSFLRPVPFIEFTAPMFDVQIFGEYMLDEHLWYYYMDLDICYRMREDGLTVAVDNGSQIHHTYLRNSGSNHPVSKARAMLRNYISPINQQYLNDKYGPDWRTFFQWKG